ncbi:hypothetical protein [Xenorhabdus santafensis]|uniref:hypothetical protein n=1 Tax=Xenorhabdus santafensis TaxID=2582833 RepID=UPI0029E810D7|nr:hypothetical protein [Xenorhabdus sp. 12]
MLADSAAFSNANHERTILPDNYQAHVHGWFPPFVAKDHSANPYLTAPAMNWVRIYNFCFDKGKFRFWLSV